MLTIVNDPLSWGIPQRIIACLAFFRCLHFSFAHYGVSSIPSQRSHFTRMIAIRVWFLTLYAIIILYCWSNYTVLQISSLSLTIIISSQTTHKACLQPFHPRLIIIAISYPLSSWAFILLILIVVGPTIFIISKWHGPNCRFLYVYI